MSISSAQCVSMWKHLIYFFWHRHSGLGIALGDPFGSRTQASSKRVSRSRRHPSHRMSAAVALDDRSRHA
jgi:hypothetical protein